MSVYLHAGWKNMWTNAMVSVLLEVGAKWDPEKDVSALKEMVDRWAWIYRGENIYFMD